MEIGLELVAEIDADGIESKWKPLDHMIYENCGAGLGVAFYRS